MTAPTSTFTYLITKTVSTRRQARALAFALTLSFQPDATVERLGPKAWKVRALVLDTDLEIVKPVLGKGYGIETFTTN